MDSKDPDAKALPVAKMMVHHFLYFAAGPPSAGRPADPSVATSSAAAAKSTRAGGFDQWRGPTYARATASTTTPGGKAPAGR